MQDTQAEAILSLAAGRFDEAEVYQEESETLSVKFEDNRLKEVTTRQRRGVGLRCILRGRIGFASTTDLRDPARLVQMAAASAKFGDEAKFALPGQPQRLSRAETYEPAMLSVDAERMVEMGGEGLEASRQANDDYLFAAGLSRSVGSQRILNTSGLDFEYRSSGMSASVEVQLVNDDGMLMIYEYKSWGRPFDSIMDITRTTLDKAAKALTVVPAKLEAMPMVFVPKALGNLFMPLAVAINGKNVQKGASVLRGRIGERVLDERITITDEPAVDYAPGSCPIDDEGTPTRTRPLFQDGVLKTYLADLQTAALLGIEPTGHGFRGYSSRPAPSDTNTLVEAGDTPYEEMIAGTKRGLIVDETLGSGQSNMLAGEFSVNVALGYLVEDGRIAGRVKDCMVAGNVYETLDRVEAIGAEREWLGSNCAPAIMVGGLKLAAQG